MTKRRLSNPKRTEPEAPKGPSVGLILGCALATGVGLGVAFDKNPPGSGRLSFANIAMSLPDTWKDAHASPPDALASTPLGAWPAKPLGNQDRARPGSAEDGPPAIAIVLDDLGEDTARVRRAMALPKAVTLSFLPYPKTARALSHEAHLAGHEILVHLSMQPMGAENPGPNALTVDLSAAELARRVDWALARVSDFEGANNHMGSRFTASRKALAPVMQVLSQHHLFYLDSRTTAATVAEEAAHEAGMLAGSRDVFLDDEDNAAAVEKQLERAEARARAAGTAIAIGHPHPETLAALKIWTASLEKKGLRLVPVSEVLKRRASARARAAVSLEVN